MARVIGLRSLLALTAACGGAVSSVAAQTAFSWVAAVNGEWSNAANWSPAGVPGSVSFDDSVTLGLTGAYTVDSDATRTVAGLAIPNAEAVLQIEPFTDLTVTSAATGAGMVFIGRPANGGFASFNIGDGVTLDIATVELRRANATVLNATQVFGGRSTLGPNAVLQGTGSVQGFLDIAGTLRARAGDSLTLSFADSRLSGGGVVDFAGGDIIFGSNVVTDMTLMGDIAVSPFETISIGEGVVFADDVRIGLAGNSGGATLQLLDGVVIDDTTVTLARANSAFLNGPFGAGERASVGANAIVQGRGSLAGFLDIAGTVLLNDGDQIAVFTQDNTLTGGGTVQFDGGDLLFNNAIVTNITLAGDIRVDPFESFQLGPGVTFADPVSVGLAGNSGGASIQLLDGVPLDNVSVTLNRLNSAIISGPQTVGERSAIGPNAIVTGSGSYSGFVDVRGVIRLEPGDQFNFLPLDGVVTGGGTIDLLGGDPIWNNVTVDDIRLQGEIRVDPFESLTVGPNVVFADPVILGRSNNSGQATLNLPNGITLSDTHVVLDRQNGATIAGPQTAGERATIGGTTLVTGSGQILGLVDIAGTVRVGSGETLGIFPPDGLITGGGVLEQSGGDILWQNLTATNVTLRDQIVVDPFESLTIGAGVIFDGTVLLGQPNNSGQATLNVLDQAAINGVEITLTRTNSANIAGPTAAGERGTIGAGAVIRGRGFLAGNLDVAAEVLPGEEAVPGPMDVTFGGDVALTPAAELNIGFASDAPGGFGQLRNASDASLHLAGTLRVRALGGFEPGSENAIDVITGGTITGAFDTVIFEGNLRPEDVVRVFYLPDRVEFVVTCNADIAPPGGTLDLGDVDAFITAFLAQDPIADLVPPFGVVDLGDIDAFIVRFLGGCP